MLTTVDTPENMEDWLNQRAVPNAAPPPNESPSERKQRKEAEQRELERLRQDILIGIEQANRGEYSTRTIDDIIADTKAKLANG